MKEELARLIRDSLPKQVAALMRIAGGDSDATAGQSFRRQLNCERSLTGSILSLRSLLIATMLGTSFSKCWRASMRVLFLALLAGCFSQTPAWLVGTADCWRKMSLTKCL
jgi:hypothetical protein